MRRRFEERQVGAPEPGAKNGKIQGRADVAPGSEPEPLSDRAFSVIWSGGQVAGPRYKSISAEMVIPDVSFPYGRKPDLSYIASAWVGFGGDPNVCDFPAPFGLLQAGFYWMWNPDGDAGVFPFYGWQPGPPVFLDKEFGVKAKVGDRVRVTVTQEGNVTGTILWENLSNPSQNYPKDGKPLPLKAEEASGDATAASNLCTNHAQWIIESFMTVDDTSNRFIDFGTHEFEKLKVLTEPDGAPVNLEDAYVMEADPTMTKDNYNIPPRPYLTDCKIIPPDRTPCTWLGYKASFPQLTE